MRSNLFVRTSQKGFPLLSLTLADVQRNLWFLFAAFATSTAPEIAYVMAIILKIGVIIYKIGVIIPGHFMLL